MTTSSALPLPRRIWWPWDQPAGRVGFARSFRLDEAAQAKLYVACSGDYQVRLDATGLDVSRSHLPSWRSLHRYDIYLDPGKHRLSFEAEPGEPGQSFLLACLDWVEAGVSRRLVTDQDWEMAVLPGAAWQPAWAFDGIWAEPWGMPCNAPDDFCRLSTGWQSMTQESVRRIASVYPGAPALGAHIEVMEAGRLEIQPPQPFPLALPRLEITRPRLEWYRTREAHSLVNNTWLDLFEARCPHVVFDLGGETFARLQLRLRSGGPAMIAVTTWESLNEVNRYARRVTDLVELQDGESFTTAPTGFRYARVMAMSAGERVAVFEPLVAQHIRYPVEPVGQFSCSDATLNAIYALSARTLHLCMQNEIWDGIKRDQLPWMGDLYTEALAAYSAFGDYRLARRTLAVLGEIGPALARPVREQRYPGLAAIWKTASGDINDIPSYTLWWLVGLWDYWMYSGDLSLIKELSGELEATLEHVARSIGPDGTWRLLGGWDFVDWAPLTPQERLIYCHLLAYRAFGCGAELLEALDKPAQAYRQLQAQLSAAARRAWCSNGRWDFGASHHVNAQAICASVPSHPDGVLQSGILTPEEAQTLFAQVLQPDPPLSMTYWHRFLDLAAAEVVGAAPWGLAYIRRHWGGALQAGMTALWEAFDPAWMGQDPHAFSMIGAGTARYGGYETSLCHGWSAGPAVWLPRAALGISPARPGFQQFHFRPQLGGLEWAEGAVPTPYGPVSLRLDQPGGERPSAWLEMPAGVTPLIPGSVQAEWKITQRRS